MIGAVTPIVLQNVKVLIINIKILYKNQKIILT